MRASGTIYKDMFSPRINEFESHDASLCLVFVLERLLSQHPTYISDLILEVIQNIERNFMFIRNLKFYNW